MREAKASTRRMDEITKGAPGNTSIVALNTLKITDHFSDEKFGSSTLWVRREMGKTDVNSPARTSHLRGREPSPHKPPRS